jgi:7,8-dihydropterin-6-yl-methyl-4-(beta-D-ribofuranosyl)aminobenzene 5'-phosphate synthase
LVPRHHFVRKCQVIPLDTHFERAQPTLQAAGGYRVQPGQFAESGVLDRRELEALKVRVVLCPAPTVIADQAFTTGVIERKSFERVLPNTLVDYSMKDGLGCNIPAAAEKAEGKPVPDVHLNEHATCFHLKDRGLIVISSCGHTGIVNTTRQAMKVSGVDKVHAILGGFHLFPADDAYLAQTVAELKTLNPDVLIPMHCSGPAGFTAQFDARAAGAVDERHRIHLWCLTHAVVLA